jgi:tetratricopeptide (TPR) repeat protein
MGVVYQARDCSLNRPVAIKMITAGFGSDPTARQRFRIEAEAIARLQHENIVRIYDIGEHDGRLYLSLEYVPGGTLQRQIAGTPQPDREAAQLVETLARAVHFMHRHGVVHRDLKPGNVLLASGGRQPPELASGACQRPVGTKETPGGLHPPLAAVPKITDFGLAKLLDAGTGPTRSETFLGTPVYSAPEQAGSDPGKVGPAADVYSLGGMLYELLTGRPPFLGATPLAILEQVRNNDPVGPRRLRPSVSVDLESICLKCLEKEPANRYASAEALADDLRCFLQGDPIRARPISSWQRAWRFTRRRPALVAWALAGVAVLGLVLVGLAGLHSARERERQRAEQKYRRFVQLRNEALVRGCLVPEKGGLFAGAEAAVYLQGGEAAAREALALAGVNTDADRVEIAPDFPDARKEEVAADCHALLVVLARRRTEFIPFGEGGERNKFRSTGEPQTALDHFLLGEEQYHRGAWKEASDSFNRALVLDPAHFCARFYLAVCHLRDRQWEAARTGLSACIERQPDFAWSYFFRSLANEKLRLLDDAEADFQKALELGDEDARHVVFLTRGIHRFAQGDLERAAADFEAARALKPGQYSAYLNLAHVHLARGHFAEADRELQAAMPLHPPAERVAGYHLHRGHALLREKKYEEALQACETAVSLSPRQPLPHEVSGRALLMLGRYLQAETALDLYLRKGGEEKSSIFRDRGLARMKLGKYPEAVEDFTQALERTPTADLYRHRGWARLFSDAAKLAVHDFSRTIELDPDSPGAWIGRATAQARLGQYREAAADVEAGLRRILDKSKDNPGKGGDLP